MKKKTETVWIIVGQYGAYVGMWFTRKEAQRGHIDDLGYMKWREAYEKGDRAVKAKIQYPISK